MNESNAPTTRSELIKFGVLVVICLVVVLVVWVTRPLIFGRIVPAVMGEGETAVTVDEPETDAEAPTETETDTVDETEDTAADEADAEEPEAEEADAGVDASGADGMEAAEGETAVSTEAESEDVDPESLPTSVPTISHVVQPGDTLTAIARKYGVTAVAIRAANNIPNPNVLRVGDTLLIPQPDAPEN